MPTSNIDPLVIDEVIVLLSAIVREKFTPDQQALIGTFLATLGSLISFNSVYLLYTQGVQEAMNNSQSKDNDMDVIKKSFETLEKGMENYQVNREQK